MPFKVAVAQFGVTVRANVVGGENLAIDTEEGHVMAWRLHANASTFK
jgi:hypothetical protein